MPEDVGRILAQAMIDLIKRLSLPNGLSAIRYNDDDILKLVKGALEQHQLLKLSPRPIGSHELTEMSKDAMVYW
jgi:alcohol dehydrogenase class IV